MPSLVANTTHSLTASASSPASSARPKAEGIFTGSGCGTTMVYSGCRSVHAEAFSAGTRKASSSGRSPSRNNKKPFAKNQLQKDVEYLQVSGEPRVAQIDQKCAEWRSRLLLGQ